MAMCTSDILRGHTSVPTVYYNIYDSGNLMIDSEPIILNWLPTIV